MRRYLRPGTPAYLQPGSRRLVHGVEIDYNRMFPNQERPDTRLLRLLGLIWATFNQAAPGDFSQLVTSQTKKGWNWAIWEQALTARILARGGNPATEIVHTGDLVHFRGEAVIDLASMFDTVVLGHWLSPEMCAAIKGRSTAPRGTRILFWADWESINQKRAWTPQAFEIFLQLRPHAMLAAASNTYGDFCIDKYEAEDQTGGKVACPHTPAHAGLPNEAAVDTRHGWDIDLDAVTEGGDPDSRTLEAVLETAYAEALSVWEPGNRADGYMFDNLLEFPFKGQATNNYPAGWTAKYRAGWTAFLTTLPVLLGSALDHTDPAERVWANGPLGITNYPSALIRHRYIEHFFRTAVLGPKSWAEISQDLADVAARNTSIVIAGNGIIGQTHYWAETAGGPNPPVNGTWKQIVDRCRELDLRGDRVLVACCQTLSQAHIFWNPGFRVPH